jgi:hypothetical protein
MSLRCTEEHLDVVPSVSEGGANAERTHAQERFVVELYPTVAVRIHLLERFCERLDDDAAADETIESDRGRGAETASRVCACFTRTSSVHFIHVLDKQHTVFDHDEFQQGV